MVGKERKRGEGLFPPSHRSNARPERRTPVPSFAGLCVLRDFAFRLFRSSRRSAEGGVRGWLWRPAEAPPVRRGRRSHGRDVRATLCVSRFPSLRGTDFNAKAQRIAKERKGRARWRVEGRGGEMTNRKRKSEFHLREPLRPSRLCVMLSLRTLAVPRRLCVPLFLPSRRSIARWKRLTLARTRRPCHPFRAGSYFGVLPKAFITCCMSSQTGRFCVGLRSR